MFLGINYYTIKFKEFLWWKINTSSNIVKKKKQFFNMKIMSLKFSTSHVTLHYEKTHLGNCISSLALGKLNFSPRACKVWDFLFHTYSFMWNCASDVCRYSDPSKFIINIHSLKLVTVVNSSQYQKWIVERNAWSTFILSAQGQSNRISNFLRLFYNSV